MHTAEAFFGHGKKAFSLTANVGTPPVPVTRRPRFVAARPVFRGSRTRA
jgi:hypothetical protein